MKKSLTIAVMLSTALSSIVSTAAYADTVPEPVAAAADSDTLDAMQAQCDLLAAAHETANGDVWSAVVVEGAVTKVSGPTEEPGSRVIDTGTIAGAGTFTYSGISIVGDPFRIGGSVNMFGNQRATQKNWTDSTYNFTADYDSTFAHAFTCEIYQEVFHPAVDIPGHPVLGYYQVDPDFHGNEEEGQNSCNAFNALAPEPPDYVAPGFWGVTPHGNCFFTVTEAATDPEHQDAYLDPAVLVGTEAGTAVNQSQVDSLYAFEDHGGPVTETGNFFVGQVVICISPSKTVKGGVPGAWQQQNGYTGAKCTTAWFNVAPWGGGSQTSNGTYISVPAV